MEEINEIDPLIIGAILVTAVLVIVNTGTQVMTFVEKLRTAKKPHDDHVQQVNDHTEQIEELHSLLRETQQLHRVGMTTDMLVLEHIISGNHVDKLKEQRDFIHRYLIDNSVLTK